MKAVGAIRVDEDLLKAVDIGISAISEVEEDSFASTHYHESDEDEALFWAGMAELLAARSRLETLASLLRVALNRRT